MNRQFANVLDLMIAGPPRKARARASKFGPLPVPMPAPLAVPLPAPAPATRAPQREDYPLVGVSLIWEV